MNIATWKSSDGNKYKIVREGKTLASGGNGVRWSCTCKEGKKGTCGHLRSLFMRTYNPDKVSLTSAGENFIGAALSKNMRRKVMGKLMARKNAAMKKATKSRRRKSA